MLKQKWPSILFFSTTVILLQSPQIEAQLSSVFHELPSTISQNPQNLLHLNGHQNLFEDREELQNDNEVEDTNESDFDQLESLIESENVAREPMWIKSGKFQGDIDGVDANLIKKLNSAPVQMNALKNKQLIWTNGIVPYVLDEAFTQSEVKLLEKAFRTYRKRTCIRFRPHQTEKDYLFIVKGLGCYSQVGKTGGKQEISLGRGCLYHEIVLHELMHSLGAWHEHSRADRDEHVRIRWENILNGMESQFDIISPALQDTQGIKYDYRSIMHYDSAAFSRNGKNTIETVEDGFTQIIGAAKDLSELDVVKLNKLYQCPAKSDRKRTIFSRSRKTKVTLAPIALAKDSASTKTVGTSGTKESGTTVGTGVTSVIGSIGGKFGKIGKNEKENPTECQDHFLDCPGFKDYCRKVSFFFVMKAYCPQTCGHCKVR